MKIFRFLLISFFVISFFSAAEVCAKDQWVQVRSKNFFLIGNASEKEIRRVATKLEQFRETFRALFNKTNLSGEVPTNVVVFKSASSYKPFKPKRADGKIDEWIAGYFQSGEDVNYITLSTEGEDADVFGTIFHEYVHFVLNNDFGKSDVPTWFNEGLAEYYQTFVIEDDIKVKLGLPQGGHLQLLQQSKLMPLDQLFSVSNYQLHQSGGHSRSIFYAQSWALIHYLIQTGKTDALGTFLKSIVNGVAAQKAFEDAFQTDYKKMEAELRRYVEKRTYNYHQIVFKNKLTFDGAMTVTPLGDAESSAYLGDLLYHTNRADDAEAYLAAAIKLQPDGSMANTTLGMVKVKQRKWDEARGLLEKAIAGDPKNHVAYYQYAYLLSREGRDEFGYVQKFAPATAAKMREALRKAITLKPQFAESYELLAFVNLVNNEELDDAVTQLKAALTYQPGNQRYLLRIGEIFVRQNKFAEATMIAEKVARAAEDEEISSRAQNLLNEVAQRKQYADIVAASQRTRPETAGTGSQGPPRLIKRRAPGRELTEAEKAERQQAALRRSINEALRKPVDGEQRVIGSIQKIDCKSRPITYAVKTSTETFTLSSVDFNGLTLNAFDTAATNVSVGCDANMSSLTAVITYRAPAGARVKSRGELVALEFVPAGFELGVSGETETDTDDVYEQDEAPSGVAITTGTPSGTDMDAARRSAMMNAINDALRKPEAGQIREVGYLEQIECKGKAGIFHFRTATQTVRLLNSKPEALFLRSFTPDMAGVRFECGIKPLEFPAVFIYAAKADNKTKTAGEILSIEFVPKSFVLK